MEKIKLSTIQWDQKKDPGGFQKYMDAVGPASSYQQLALKRP